jgi:hypothetical protein
MPKPKTNKVKSANRAAPVARQNKLLTIIAMLRRPDGATIMELCQATGWKSHSIRGAISGSVSKRRLMKVSSEAIDGIRTYRIIG